MTAFSTSRWFERIQFKVGILLVLLVSLVMVAFGVYGATTRKSVLDWELDQLMQKVGDRASAALALSLWEFNQEQGVEAIIAEMADSRVESLVLLDSYGDVFAARVRNGAGEVTEPDADSLPALQAESDESDDMLQSQSSVLRSIELDVMHEEELVGTLLLQVNERQMQATLIEFYVERIWQTVLLVLITVTVMLIALQYILISPLRILTEAAGSLSVGELDTNIVIKSNDEVGQLGRALEVFRQNAVEKEGLQEQREVARLEREQQEKELLRLAEERQVTEERLRVQQQEAVVLEREQSRELQSRVDELLSTVDAVAAGYLLTPMSVTGEDAIGRISEKLGHVFTLFAESIRSIGSHADQLGDASGSLTGLSESIASSANVNSVRAVEVSEASEEINDGVNNVASAITQMSATVNEIANNADQATEVAKEAKCLTTDASGLVSKLSESSTDIGTVIKVITSIAEQTNLLALNATIEAARAGDAGKGFAVVANEVKELAKETAKATDDISQRIQTIQRDSGSVTDSISGISSIIDKINELQLTISVSVDEQASASKEISRIVSHTATGSQIIASSINEVADAASDSLVGANSAKSASVEMDEMASKLRDVVSQFHIEVDDGV